MDRKELGFRYFLGLSLLIVSIIFLGMAYYYRYWKFFEGYFVFVAIFILMFSSISAILGKKECFYLGMIVFMFFMLIVQIWATIKNLNINTVGISIFLSLLFIMLGLNFYARFKEAHRQAN